MMKVKTVEIDGNVYKGVIVFDNDSERECFEKACEEWNDTKREFRYYHINNYDIITVPKIDSD